MRKNKKPFLVERVYAIILAVGGALGLASMTWQAGERINMLKNPGAGLVCNLDPVIDCGGVLEHPLSAVLGYPNAFLGMIFFAILATSGLVLLSGGKFVGWYRHFVMAVLLVLLSFSLWFFGVSLYVLGKICIFCVVGWISSIPMFWYGLLYYLQSSSAKTRRRTGAFTSFGLKHHLKAVVLVYVVMLALFLIRFRDYYFQ